MSFLQTLGSIFSSATARIVDSVGNAVDRNLTTDHERLEIEARVRATMAEVEKSVIAAHIEEQAEITKRHAADMASDSWLAKNIRPLTLIFVTIAVTTLSFVTIFNELSEGQRNVLSAWIGLWTGVMLAVYSFYFTSRGLEKIATVVGSRLGGK